MMTILDLTIAIPVKNEEKTIQGCLDAIGKDFAKHVIIIDSESSDETIKNCKNYDVEIIKFTWNGKFPKKRNWFLRNYNLKTKWILFLDADEYINQNFKDEVRKKISSQTDINGFYLNYSIYFLGKKLNGGYPLKKLALFKVGSGEYEKIPENNWSKCDMEVHEHPIISGKKGVIKCKIDHRDDQGISRYINKQNEYVNWEAYRFLHLTEKQFFDLSINQKIKYRLLKSIWGGPIYFFGNFLLLGGFIDGFRGMAFSILKMSYFNQVYCKIKELQNNI